MTTWNLPTLPNNPQWSPLPTPTPPTPVQRTGFILQEDGFKILQQDGFGILFETTDAVGFQPVTNQPVTIWT